MSDFYNKYPYTDFHELNLDWVIERVKKLTEDWLATQQEWNDTEEQWQQLHDYVMNYFDNLDVSQEINDKIDAMVSDGTFLDVIRSTVESQTITTTTSWLADHITQPTTPAIDTSLSIAGAAADAKATGDNLTDIRSDIRANIENLLNGISDVTNVNYVWEQGTFAGDGTLQPSLYRARNPLFISRSLFDSILLPYTDKYDFSIQQYDANQTFISAIGWILKSKYYIYTPADNVASIRIGARLKTSAEITATELAELDAFDFKYIIYDYNTKIESLAQSTEASITSINDIIDHAKLLKEKSFTWEQGSITSGADVPNQYRGRCVGYLPVNKGDIFVINPDNGYNYAYSLIGINYQFVSGVNWLTEKTVLSIPDNVAYVRVNAKHVPDIEFDSDALDGAATNVKLFYNEHTNIINKRPDEIRAWDPLIGQDCTMVDGKLWIFYDSDINPSIYKLDLDTEQATTSESQHMGHCNSVDYNPNNDYMMIYSTSTNNNPKALLYKNPSAASDMRPSDGSCTVVELYNAITFLNPSASICWGENNNIMYMIDGIYDDLGNNHLTPDIKITKILLGMGDNDLSSIGYGTFIYGRSTDEYNGTCKVIKTYSGVISDEINAKFDPNNKLGTAQGMEYDGDIYIAWGFSGHNFLQIRLNDNDDTYKVIKNYMHEFTDYTGTVRYLEPEMLALNNDKIICGSIKSPNFSMLSFNR